MRICVWSSYVCISDLRALADPDIDFFWLLNNETVVHPDAPAAIIREFERDEGIGMVGTIVRFYHRPDRLQLLNGSRFSTWTGRGYPIAGGEDAQMVIDAGFVRAQHAFVCGPSLAFSRTCVATIWPMD